MAEPYITINGMKVPQPRRGLTQRAATIVDGSRNSNAVFVGQKIGRDQHKLEGIEWGYLDAATWSRILQIFNQNFTVKVRFPDMVTNTWKTIEMYPGDRTATPYFFDETTGLPTGYINCKVNLIDTGK